MKCEVWEWKPGRSVGPLKFLMYRSNVRSEFAKLNLQYTDYLNQNCFYIDNNKTKNTRTITNSDDMFNSGLVRCSYTRDNKFSSISFERGCKFQITYNGKAIFPGTVGNLKELIRGIYIDDDSFHQDSKGLYFCISPKYYSHFVEPDDIDIRYIAFSTLSLR